MKKILYYIINFWFGAYITYLICHHYLTPCGSRTLIACHHGREAKSGSFASVAVEWTSMVAARNFQLTLAIPSWNRCFCAAASWISAKWNPAIENYKAEKFDSYMSWDHQKKSALSLMWPIKLKLSSHHGHNQRWLLVTPSPARSLASVLSCDLSHSTTKILSARFTSWCKKIIAVVWKVELAHFLTSFSKTDLAPLTPIPLKRSKNINFLFKNPSLIINKWKIGLSHVYVRNMKGSQIDLSFGSTETMNNTMGGRHHQKYKDVK